MAVARASICCFGLVEQGMRIRLGDLRCLVREAADPFAERPTLMHGIDLLQRLEDADVETLPVLLKKIASSSRSQTMMKAAGLAVHMVQDFKALQALIMVAIKDVRRS